MGEKEMYMIEAKWLVGLLPAQSGGARQLWVIQWVVMVVWDGGWPECNVGGMKAMGVMR